MGHVITFAQQKGGAGKTTLLAQLAQAFSLSNQSVALLDLDPQGSLTMWASLADIEGLTMIETASYRIAGDIRSAKDRYDLILVDCPGNASATLESAIAASDLVLVPCQPNKLDLWAVRPIIETADAEKVAHLIVLNRVPPFKGGTEAVAESLAADFGKPAKTRIGNRVAYSRSIGDGKTVFQLGGQPKAVAEIKALAKEIKKSLK